jgi:beta-lactamase regulating signal transducer with metallopeptidase domain
MNFTASSYLLNVALHATVLSASAWIILALLRPARYCAIAALAGLLGIACLPWLSALRSPPPEAGEAAEIQSAPLPSWTVATLQDVSVEPAITSIPATAVVTDVPRKRELPDVLTLLAAVWLAGAVGGLCMIGIDWLKVRAWRKSLMPLDETNWSALRSIVPEIQSREHILISTASASPCVVGFRKPRIVLPGFLFKPDSDSGLRWAVRHELAHRNARDSRWMMCFALVRCLYWWNPFVHRLVLRWADAREQICDLEATGVSEDRADYGEFLVDMARRIGARPPLTIAMAQRPCGLRLKHRIESLLGADSQAARPAGLRFTVSCIMVVVMLAALTSGIRIGAAETTMETKPEVDEKAVGDVSSKKVTNIRVPVWLVFSTTKPSVRHGAIFKDGELDSYIETARKKGSVVAPTSDRIELGREGILTMSQFYDRATGKSHWGGGENWGSFGEQRLQNFTKFSMSAKFENDQTHLKIKGRHAYIPGSGFPRPDKIPIAFDEDRIYQYKEAYASAVLKIGEVVCVDFGKVEPGVYLQFFAMVVPQTSDHRDVGQYSGNIIRRPSAEVKGRVRVSGMRISIPIEEKLPYEYPLNPRSNLRILDELAYPIPNNAGDYWKKVIFSKVEELAPVEFPLNELHAPWPSLPGFELKVIASEDYQRFSITGKPAADAVDRQERTIDSLPNGFNLSFKTNSADRTEKSRVFFTVKVVR